MNRSITGTLCAALLAVSACAPKTEAPKADMPEWLEPDSAYAIEYRIMRDFPMTVEESLAAIQEKRPDATIDSVYAWIEAGYIETMEIDGKQMVHRKAPRNLNLLHPRFNNGWQNRGGDASMQRISYADSVIRNTQGKLPNGGAHRIKVRFSVDVPFDSALMGDTLRIWMPYPIESQRQKDINLVSVSTDDYIISTPEQSAHRTLYCSMPAPAPGETAHAEYVVELTTMGQYFSPETIEANIKPYDTESDVYKQFTAVEEPHIIRLDSLAKSIVGNEASPYKQSELVYNYIVTHYPWAGAREYSTIECIPQYVIDSGHGDCGQVALLYISLMRSLGVPARWESGWMLHPGELNYHDWAEVYFEGVGWVPVDVSFGRYTTCRNTAVRNFYSTGIDSYRFATNTGVCQPFYPEKKYLRSETVDSQAGEVECSKGNLFYPGWNSTLEIISSTPIEL